MPNTPEAQRQIDEYRARQRARLRSGAYLDAPSVWTRAQVEPGWAVYSRTRAYAEDPDQPIGGLVVDVLPAWSDRDTGEMFPLRFRVFDPYRRNSDSRGYAVITLDDVDESRIDFNRVRAWAGAVALLGMVNLHRRIAHPRDVEYLHDALVLAAESAAL